ncbi:MAG: RHS repeat-associated core domain-containing protein [Aestuariibacter sp.]|nr:RHS repeat-associated core domain-containing protein [Aestuariibacter sp.]
MREQTNSQNVVYYLHGDHLGSTSLSTDANGAVVARQLYYPYGEERWSSGTLTTDYGFTGQRREQGIGLYDYNARFYDPALGRFVSADTIVPSPGDPQAWNRYSYVLGNPLKYIDPTGHCATNGYGSCGGSRDSDWKTSGKLSPGSQVLASMAYEHYLEDPDYFVRLYFNDPNSDELGHLSDYAQYHDGVYVENLLRLGDVGVISAGLYRDLANDYEAGKIDRDTFLRQSIQVLGSVIVGVILDQSTSTQSSRSARRQVMRDLGIPTSQQPSEIYVSSDGRTSYVYEVTAPGGGTRKMIVTQHPFDVNHGAHWEGGVVKLDDFGDPVLNPYGIPRYYNLVDGLPKPRSPYSP